MLRIEGFNTRHTIPLMMVLMIGTITGWLGFMLLGDFAGNTEVVYVSAKEVLKAEKERIAAINKQTDNGTGEHPEGKGIVAGGGKESVSSQIFYGYPDQALALMEKLALSLKGRRTKIVFVSDSAVRGEEVSSASKRVHAGVLRVIERKVGGVGKSGNVQLETTR